MKLSVDKVADMVANMMVDMEDDKVADMVANMVADHKKCPTFSWT